MYITLLLLSCLLVTVTAVKIKVANTMGKDTTATFYCKGYYTEPTIDEAQHLTDGQDHIFEFDYQFPLTCPTKFSCGVSGGKTGEDSDRFGKFEVPVICTNIEEGYFLRGDGIYKGTLTGGDIQKISDFNCCPFADCACDKH